MTIAPRNNDRFPTTGMKAVTDSRLTKLIAGIMLLLRRRLGRSHPLDRYARTARFAPASDEAIVLEAMRHARFSLWRVERRHETAGLILQDLLRGGEIWLVDETMEKSAPRGVEMAARLLQPESFAMTARIIGPVTSDLMEEVFTRAPALQRTQGQPCPGPTLRDRHLPITPLFSFAKFRKWPKSSLVVGP